MDLFADIAARRAQARASLVEPAPPPPPRRVFRLGAPDPAHAWREPRPALATPVDFDRELACLRRRMAPFLRSLPRPPAPTRVRKNLPRAEWFLETPSAPRALPPDDDAPWESVALPHFGGPSGRAVAWYRLRFDVTEKLRAPGRLFLRFGGVDYRAQVFVNGGFVGQHEGFFAPFEFDVTRFVRDGGNTLHVRVENDYRHMGNAGPDGVRLDGDKLYAGTGLGWDEPGSGWHHCPPGMGIHRPVTLEARPPVFVHDVFVRPLPDEDRAEVWIEVQNTTPRPVPVALELRVEGENFSARRITPRPAATASTATPDAGLGLSLYRISVPLSRARRWSPDAPWLYRATVTLRSSHPADSATRVFGMRDFHMETDAEPRGRLLLNNRPIRLRGTNTMGHEQQCVFRGDRRQLLDDLLIVKLTHLNFVRFTQRPVEPEVYDLCDRLGLLAQTDLPLFAHLRRPAFAEAVRQAGELERIVRGHACNVLVSYINEPFPREWSDKTHRHLDRAELESFFRAANEIIRLHNPERVIKPIDGDYDPPGPGLPDNHVYCGWYNGHALDLGHLHAGHWVPVKPGWLYGCGEYGSEGLDPADLMRRRYPADWLPRADEPPAAWTPARIPQAQTWNLHTLWMDPQDSLEDWVRASQAHQAWSVRLMAEAIRRDARLVSSAVHLLIDAFPAGWMKALVDCERRPKPGWFAFRDAMTPLAVLARHDRAAWFGGELFETELWLCDDRETPDDRARELRFSLEIDGRTHASGRARIEPTKTFARCVGRLRHRLPRVATRTLARLRVALCDADGRALHVSTSTLSLFPKTRPPAAHVTVLGADNRAAARLVKTLGARPTPLAENASVILCDAPDALRARATEVERAVRAGARLVLLGWPEGEHTIAGLKWRVETAGYRARHFASRKTGHPLVEGFEPDDFRFWHDADAGRVTPFLPSVFFAEGWTPVLATGQADWGRGHVPAHAVATHPLGEGEIIACQIELAARTKTNPASTTFAHRLLRR